MKRSALWWGAVTVAGLLTGCVERRYVITSDPPGAMVYDQEHKPLAPAPADGTFIYPGNYRFTLLQDGYETLQVDQPIDAKWYDYFPFDFIVENLIPWRIHDVRRFHYQMQPLQAVRSDQVINRAQELRNRGAGIGTPPPPPPAPVFPAPAPVPPPAPPVLQPPVQP